MQSGIIDMKSQKRNVNDLYNDRSDKYIHRLAHYVVDFDIYNLWRYAICVLVIFTIGIKYK